MDYLRVVPPEEATGSLKETYDTLQEMFGGMIPKVFVSQSIRPDLLGHLTQYVKSMLIEDHGLSRKTKELIAAYVSKINSCAY